MRSLWSTKSSVGVIALFTCFGVVADAQTWVASDAPGHIWSSIASSADGTKVVAVSSDYQIQGSIPYGSIFLSTNSGMNWLSVTNVPAGEWICAASSADGLKLSAIDAAGGLIWESLDGGVNWTHIKKTPSPYLDCLATSALGKTVVAGAWDDFGHPSLIYVSQNYGKTWFKAHAPSGYWSGIACSSDGKKMIATSAAPGQILRSTDFGETWKTARVPTDSWYYVTSSSQGNVLAATLPGKAIYVSTNSGVSWADTDQSNEIWQAIACSADGHEIVAVANGGFGGSIHISGDYGQTWTNADAPHLRWRTVSVSADGNKIIAGTIDSGVYTFQASTALPPLHLDQKRKKLIISWVVPSSPAVLQHSSDGVNWINVTQKPLLNLSTLNYEIILPLTNDQFRLAPL